MSGKPGGRACPASSPQVFVAANVLAVPIELPVKSVAELVAFARAQPGKLSYAQPVWARRSR
ncbi:hypothetical protein [Bradyrhizobium sp.]|uniref:hypothetical protein n=1 Tax=Bradyrhizobium sp. TaxID=376 RepID=UPI002E0AD375|nr:hypothetical protein [Bradyrhizobium sp.]